MKVNITFIQFIFVVSLFFFSITSCFGQNNNIVTLSPQGFLEQNFDRYGNKYSLWQININQTLTTNSVSTGKFTLFFENGSGMENPNDAAHLKRRLVLMTVISDYEKFIKFPQTNQKINLWIRDIKSVSTFAISNLSSGSSFYNVAKSTTGSIVDGAVFKSLVSGRNSYKNVVNVPNNFYHGYLSFNFRFINGNPITWHTDLTTPPAYSSYDLYTAMLKEFTHLLGFCSLINQNGTSVFGNEFEYFSRYDLFLKNQNGDKLLTSPNNNGIDDYTFNPNLSNQILRPNCSIPDNINYENTDNSDCWSVLSYESGGVKTKVYTPDCFEPGYSFSCLEDQLYPDCNAPYGNNLYFATSNNLNIGTYKRYPTLEERIILTDIGYKINTTFGASGVFDSFQSYSNTTDATPLEVIGINDGTNPDLTLSFVGNVTGGIQISGVSLLQNDFQANSFVGLQCLTSGGSVNITTGNSGSNIAFSSTTGGLFLLRYIPSNGTQNGNITYFYVYMNANNNCGTPLACESVINGNFESYVQLPIFGLEIDYICNWNNFSGSGTALSYYNHINSPSPQHGVPTNFCGYQNDNVVNNKAYAALSSYYWPNNPNFPPGSQTSTTISQIIRTKLTTPMIAGKKYKISYQVSKGDDSPATNSFALQAFVTAANFQPNLLNFLSSSQIVQGSLYTNSNPNGTPSFITSTTAWTTLSFDHVAAGGEEYLYIGALHNAPYQSQPSIAGGNSYAWYYYDNVSVKIIEEAINDNYQFNSISIAVAAQTSILVNDNFSGNGANLLITQTPTQHPYLSINTDSKVVVAANTPPGTYSLNYNFTNTCSVSTSALITVVVFQNAVTGPPSQRKKVCNNKDDLYITTSPLDPNSGWHYATNVPFTYKINGVPATAGQLRWYPFTNNIPSCISMNQNGSLTVQANCTGFDNPSNLYQLWSIACDANNPNSCSEPILTTVMTEGFFEANSCHIYINQNGDINTSPNFNNGDCYMTEMNVLATSFYCANAGPATASQVTITETSSNPYWNINTATGEIYLSSPAPIGTSTVYYQMLLNGYPPEFGSSCSIIIHITN